MKTLRFVFLALAFVLAGCSDNEQSVPLTKQRDFSAELLALTNTHMAELTEEQPYLQMLAGKKVEKMADLSHAATLRNVEKANAKLTELASIDRQQLSHDDQLTYDMFEGILRQTVEV